jgi:hypothetical protein
MIIKSKHAGNYTILPNEVFEQQLSMEAIGLLSYFLSLPSDWVIYKSQLHSQLNIGREKLDRMFKELQEKGYVLTIKKQNEIGKISYDHIVYDKPYNDEPLYEKPYTEKPSTEMPSTAKQHLLNTNINNKQYNNKHTLKNLSENLPSVSKFIPPTKQQVEDFFVISGYKKEVGANAFNYYSIADWKDSKGKQVKNWKQKMQGNWFRDEHKIKETTTNKIQLLK